MITGLLTQFIIGHSLTLAPLSFTYHNFVDPAVEKYYRYTIGKRTTIHPGLHLKYEHKYFQNFAWYFRDSFGRHAGGFLIGPKIDIWWFSLGAAGGLYVRQHKKITPLKFPFHRKVGPVALAGLGGATGSLKIPVAEKTAIEVGCLSAWKVTNCSIGLNWEW